MAWPALFLLALSMPAQDSPFSQKPKPKPAAAPEAEGDAKDLPAHLKSLPHRSNYFKALEYIKKNFAGRDWRTIPDLFSGLVFLLDGREEVAMHLEKSIAIAKRKVLDDKAFNGNWFVAYSALFLAIVYSHDKLPDVKEALEAGFQVALRTREDDTQGWGHNKGWGRSSGYYKKGGAVDLGIVTATMLSAALIARENGVDVPPSLIEGARKNLASISRNGVVTYGTSNGWTGFVSRSAAAFAGLHAAKQSSDPIYTAVTQGLPKEISGTEKGHAYGPIHFFANALAMQLMGKFSEYGNFWIAALNSRQQSDGSVAMQHDGGKRGTEKPELGATAVYALMLLMQKEKLLPAPGKGPRAPGGGSSPFSMKRPKIDDKELPSEQAPTGPTTGSGGKE
jgi:hypothetical protein